MQSLTTAQRRLARLALLVRRPRRLANLPGKVSKRGRTISCLSGRSVATERALARRAEEGDFKGQIGGQIGARASRQRETFSEFWFLAPLVCPFRFSCRAIRHCYRPKAIHGGSPVVVLRAELRWLLPGKLLRVKTIAPITRIWII